MASDSLRRAPEAAAQASRLAAALGAIEAQLDALEPGAASGVVALALAKPIEDFDAAVREAGR